MSVIQRRRNKKKSLEEIKRVLKKGGKIFLVENDSIGEFEEMREHPKRTKNFNKWLKNQGFKEKKMDIKIKFENLKTAKEIFEIIWGRRISNKVKNNIIKNKIIIFENKKF